MDEFDPYIAVMSAQMELIIADEHRPGVTQFLQLARDMAELLDEVPLDESELALAPVFTPPDPPVS